MSRNGGRGGQRLLRLHSQFYQEFKLSVERSPIFGSVNPFVITTGALPAAVATTASLTTAYVAKTDQHRAVWIISAKRENGAHGPVRDLRVTVTGSRIRGIP